MKRLFPVVIFYLLPFFILGGDFKFRNYTIKDGLAHNAISQIIQDKDGFIWIATGDGLSKFDGNNFYNYRPSLIKGKQGLQGNRVGALTEDKKGNIWMVVEQQGIDIYDKQQDKIINYLQPERKFEQNFSESIIFCSSDSNIWYTRSDGSLLNIRQRLKQDIIYSADNEDITRRIADVKIKDIVETDNKKIVVLGKRSISIIDLTSGKVERIFNGLNTAIKGLSNFHKVVSYKEDTLIIASDKGLLLFDFKQGQIKPLIANTYFRYVTKDKDNWVWAFDINNKLYKINLKTKVINSFFSKIDAENYHANQDLTNIFIDRDNNVWCGSSSNGILFSSPYERPVSIIKHTHDTTNSISNNNIWAIHEDKKGNIWLGFDKGLDKYNVKTGKFHALLALSNLFVGSIAETNDGRIWGGTYNNGAFKIINPDKLEDAPNKLEIETFTPVTTNTFPLRCWSLRSIVKDKSGNLWFGGIDNGVDILRSDEKKIVHLDDLIYDKAKSTHYLWNIFPDKNGNIWLGSNVNGLSFYNPHLNYLKNYLQVLINEQGRSIQSVMSIYVDSKDRIWLGTGGKGLVNFDTLTKKTIVFTEEDGLINNTVYGILEDSRGVLWLSTNKGVCKFNPDEKRFTNINSSKIQCNPGAYFKGHDGTMYFGSTQGLITFHPDSIKEIRKIPKIVLNDFKILNKHVEVGDDDILNENINNASKINIPYNHHQFTIDFAALEFTYPSNISYRYKLEGFDSDWITVNADRRIAIYTNLNPGTYTLRIKSTNGEGIWQQNDKILLINVLRPFWQMWWFYLAAAVFLLFLLYLFFKIRLLRITRQKSELENMVKLRTREVERQKEEIVAQKIEIENKQLEIIDQAIKLHEQDQSKITFFTNISHEFRTPLTLIEGPLSEVIRNNKNPESDTFLKLIEKNVKRLLRLVNQLLDIEKIEAKNLAPTYIHSDLNEFLRSTAQLFQPLAVSTKINYEINVDPSIQFAEFDPDILDKILYNVLSNAFKYTPPYGHIVFSVNIDEKNKLHLEVSDTGVGMTPNNLKNIFERFYQGENAVYKTGTGIGLYLVKQLVELLNGTITAESEKDKGTKIRIVLPYNKSSESSVVLVDDFKETEIISTDLSEADIQVRTHILIIDDNEDMRNYLGKVLGKNYSVFYAENATQALEEVEKSLPELILSDVMMPGMDGIELCRKLKSDIRTSHLPLILLTAKAFDEDKNEGFLAGADDYIIKPFNSQLLKVRIANLINSRKRIKERYGKEVSLEFKEITVSQLDEKLLERLTVLIGANLQNENLDVEFLCKEIGISRTLLYNKLKTLTGLTIGDFILNIRLKKAINLMLTIGSLSITEISELVGFNDPEYFRKIFKKNMGCSPTEYLKKHSS